METYTVSREFIPVQEFVTTLPQKFDEVGLVIHNGRNIIKKVDTSYGTLVVKNFRGMYLFNRIAYSLFRRSKAARSYIYSGILNAHGILTPAHVGWIDCYKMGFLTRSYFVSVFSPHQTLEEVIRYYNIYEPNHKKSLWRDVAAFALRLHQLGIYHEDLSLGNILVKPEPRGHQFTLVDLNRIKFHKISYEEGLQNLVTLRAAPDDLNTLVCEYATLSGRSPESSVETFWKFENRKKYFRRIRRRIRRYTISPIERLLDRAHLL
jgi:tRNA A-37 threonylcarbamoyl transferase component Bud32